MFVSLGLSGVVPVIHGVMLDGYQRVNERMGLGWILLQGAMYIFGAFLYAVRPSLCDHASSLQDPDMLTLCAKVRWPERQFLVLSIYGAALTRSFHVFVLLAAASHLMGMATAFDFHHSILGGRC